jgi:hypothetical protein
MACSSRVAVLTSRDRPGDHEPGGDVVRAGRLSQLVELGTLTAQAAGFPGATVNPGLTILVADGTQTGSSQGGFYATG